MSRFGLIGATLGHSYSKQIHSLLGNPDYAYFELTPKELDTFMRAKAFCGVNVTIPYKVDVMPYCDFISDEAGSIGSVNTVVNRGGKFLGFNTDAYGFAYTAKRASISFKDKKVIILGSGGTSRTARYVVSTQGARETVVVSRTGENNYRNLHLHYDADVIINTTPVGMFPNMDASPITLDGFERLCGVIDVIYNPSQTDLLFQSRERSIPYSNGLPMLVAQARRAHELFFDTSVKDGLTEQIVRKLSLATQSIVLTGMPGSGKSTVGRLLAEKLSLPFVDTDALIAQTVGTSPSDFIKQNGESLFRDVEENAVREALSGARCVVATGGGAILREQNRRLIGRQAFVVGLDAEDERLASDGRPLSRDLDAIHRLRAQREHLYQRVADVRITTSNDPMKTLAEVLGAIGVG